MGAPRLSSVPPVERSERVPRELGRYTVLGTLSSGGMATVYLGRQGGAAGFERIVAIKCCHDHLRSNAAFAEMFLDEARLAARIRHHNVVGTLDVSDGDPLYLVMEYIEGCSLSALARSAVKRGAAVPLDVSLRIVSDALAGLHAAHECRGPDGEPLGLVHCDVSPQNILVGVDGSARITDFGIARATARMTIEEQSVIKGKPSYMAPEQLMSGDVTRRADVFSTGVVLWELVTGRSLFRGADDWVTMHAVLTRPIPPPSSVAPSLPRELDEVLLRALARDPAERLASAGDFLSALEHLSLPIASARRVSEYVRGQGVVKPLPSQAPSGSYPRGEAPRLPVAPRPEDDERTPRSEHPARASSSEDLPTRLFEPPPELVAATVREASQPDADAYRSRRMIVAIVLILVGCACGLLFSRAPAPAPAAPPATASPAPVPIEPAHP
jgi:serine/threonine protein kinase